MQDESGSTADGAPRTLGEFELVRVLGQGGAGVVWEAWQPSLRRLVAVKVLSPRFASSPSSRERFRTEAEAGARINHPGVVAVHQVGEHDGSLFIAQELVADGQTLADWLDERRRSTELGPEYYATVAALFADVAMALQAAHELGIVHRDVKPNNVLITRDGHPKVADFGIARIDDALTLSRTGELLGTPYYMSPEQVDTRRGNVGPRSDVFSLGATMYEALTFARPFEGDTGVQVMQRILTDEPLDPRQVRSRVPRDLALECMRALEKEPARRYASMAEFAADLRRFAAGEAVLAREPSAFELARRWTRRHPAIAGAGAIALIALVAIGSLAFRLAREAERATAATHDALGSAARATEAKTTAESVLGFVVELLSNSDPLNPRAAPASVDELLEQGVRDARERFKDDRRVGARLLHAFGRIYLSKAKVALARDLFADALDGYRHTLGATAAPTLEAQAALGTAQMQLGKLDEADAVLTGARSVASEATREDRLAGLQIDAALGSLRFLQKRFEDAQGIFERAAVAQEDLLAPDDPMRQRVLANLGLVAQQLGHLDEAERRLRELVQLRRKVLSDGNPSTMNSLNSLGLVCRDLGRLDEAEACFREARDGLAGKLPDEHDFVLNASNNLADVLVRKKHFAEAEPIVRAVLEKRRKLRGAAHGHTLLSQTILVRALVGLDRRDEALEFARELVKFTPTGDPARADREALLKLLSGAAAAPAGDR